MNALLQLLIAEYGPPTSFSSARLGDVTGDVKQFKIDDENGHDCYAGFCRIFVTAPAGLNQILLGLHNSPHNAEVSRFVADAGGEICIDTDGAAAISIVLDINDSKLIKQFAKIIRGVTKRGQHYPDRNWKWIAPRTADALERFVTLLATQNRSSRAATLKKSMTS